MPISVRAYSARVMMKGEKDEMYLLILLGWRCWVFTMYDGLLAVSNMSGMLLWSVMFLIAGVGIIFLGRNPPSF